MELKKLKANLKKDYSSFKKIKLAILSDASTEFLTLAIRGLGYDLGYDFEIYVATYGALENELLNTHADLYKFNPDFILLFQTVKKLQSQFYFLNDEHKQHFAEDGVRKLQTYYDFVLSKNSSCKIIYANFPEMFASVFGNYATKVSTSFEYQLRKLNFELMNLCQKSGNLFINDLSKIQNLSGIPQFHDSRMHINADFAYAPEILPTIAKNTTDIILALDGHIKKCVIVDLDNTLWGGVIGDDGIENIEIGSLGIGKAFTEFQIWLKQLQNRGIILAVCSQNNEEIAQGPFLNHPEMVLKLEDFAIFVANWGSKAENIKHIQKTLNSGFNSLVFLDDDPYQRTLVKNYLPEVCVPDLPKDPSDYLAYLNSLNLFETSTYSDADKQRNQYYREEVNREALKGYYTTEADYLKKLEMVAEVLPFNAYTLPRISQLIQRSNQFNLRTIRYTEAELQALSQSHDHICLAFSLHDKFGNYDIVSIIILREESEKNWFIDTWIMSCRVLKRGLEDFVLNHIIALAKSKQYHTVIGEYIPTTKNALVANHYAAMQFRENDLRWHLDVATHEPEVCYIQKKEQKSCQTAV